MPTAKIEKPEQAFAATAGSRFPESAASAITGDQDNMQIAKIFIMGAGNIGASCAEVMVRKQLGDVYLYDIKKDFAIGQAMDINHATPSWNSDSRVTGTNSLDDLRDSDIVVITAGIPRRDGMSRMDLLNENKNIILEIGSNIMAMCPAAKVLLVTNPVDILTWCLKNKFPNINVFGLGCALDALRFRYFISNALNVSVESASGMVIGIHNDSMIPLVSHATVGGVPIAHLLPSDKIASLVKETKEAGTRIVHMLKNRSGFYAASNVITLIIESILFNKSDIFPVDVICNGEYGYNNICLALPSIIDKTGIRKTLEFKLNPEEAILLNACANDMKTIARELDVCK